MRKFLMLLMMLGLICLNAAALAGAPAAENNAANAVQHPFSERLIKLLLKKTAQRRRCCMLIMPTQLMTRI